jgi:hypothetical protein
MLPKRTAPGAKKEWVPTLVKGPVDFFGMVDATGELIVLDAKQSENVSRFRIDGHVTPEQVIELERYGRNGAHAGLLLYSLARAAFYWMNWHHLLTREASIEWTDPRLIFLGHHDKVIQWAGVIGARKTVPSRFFRGGTIGQQSCAVR